MLEIALIYLIQLTMNYILLHIALQCQRKTFLCIKSLQPLDNTIKVQRVFSFDACRIQFIARSLKYARYVFNHKPRGHQRDFKQKSPTAKKKEFSGFARRQDAEIPGVFQGRQHSKTEQFTLSEAHCTPILLSKQAWED